MKKFFCLTIAVILLIGLAACDNTGGNDLSAGDAVSSEIRSSEMSVNTESETSRAEELANQINELNDLLSDANAENDKLQKQLGAEKGTVIDTVYVKNKVYMTVAVDYFPEDTAREAYTVSIEYEDGTVVEVLNHHYIWMVEVSPNGSKIILNDFEMERASTVFLYDTDKRKTRKLQITELPDDTTPSYMKWLDDRYFLFVVQDDSGSIARGGDVYLYDTEKDEYKPIIVNSDSHFQTAYFDVNNAGRGVFNSEFVLFNSVMYNENYSFADNKHHILSIDEISDLYNNGNTVDLSKENGLSSK